MKKTKKDNGKQTAYNFKTDPGYLQALKNLVLNDNKPVYLLLHT